jgi:hypothetical protein
MEKLTPEQAQAQLDVHTREISRGISPDGCPYWLDWAKKNFDPRKEVNSLPTSSQSSTRTNRCATCSQVCARAIQG